MSPVAYLKEIRDEEAIKKKLDDYFEARILNDSDVCEKETCDLFVDVFGEDPAAQHRGDGYSSWDSNFPDDSRLKVDTE